MTKEEIQAAKTAWQKALQENPQVQEFKKRIDAGLPGYKTVDELASETGQIAGRILSDSVVKNAVDGRMTAEDAEALLTPTMTANHKYVADAAVQAQININRAAGNGLGAVRPELNRDRISGIAKEIGDAEDVARLASAIISQVENASMSIADDAVRANADFQYKSGRNPKIIRQVAHNCCAWCADRAGTYNYESVRGTGNDVYRRHSNCRCVVEFDPGNGTRQDVWSKRIYSKGEVERRKRIGVESDKNSEFRQMIRLSTDGNTYAAKGSTLYINAMKIPPIEGFTDIVSHGDPYSIVFHDTSKPEKEGNVSAAEFAKLLEMNEAYTDGPIRLIACSTGKDPAVVPQYLANYFHVNVLAPTEDVWVLNSGEIVITDSEKNATLGISTGEWRLFEPRP